MNKKIEEHMAKEISKVKNLEKEIALLKKSGIGVKTEGIDTTFKSQINAIGGSKMEDFIGKSLVVTKDAKMGSMQTYTNDMTLGKMKTPSVYDEMTSVFGLELVQTNAVNHTYFGMEDRALTADGVPVDECAPAEENVVDVAQAMFKISKYALDNPTSIEFNTFISGAFEGIVKSMIRNLNNSFIKHSLNADATNTIGMLNQGSVRKFPAQELATAGVITADEVLQVMDKAPAGIKMSGYFVIPASSRSMIGLLKDTNGAYIFRPAYDLATSFAGFNQVGIIAGRPVIEIPDYIWFKNGEDMTTAGKALVAFVDESAFKYYAADLSTYAQNFPSVIESAEAESYDIVIDIVKGSNPGCLDLKPMAIRGFGITDPNAGALLINPVVRKNK